MANENNTREKLIKLLASKPELLKNLNLHISKLYKLADYLITNGISFQEESHWATEQAFKNGYEKGKQDATGWISVKDRLPDTGKMEKYLVVAKSNIKTGDCYIWLAWHSPKKGFFFYDPEWANVNINSSVTHWMPLPQPPKGE